MSGLPSRITAVYSICAALGISASACGRVEHSVAGRSSGAAGIGGNLTGDPTEVGAAGSPDPNAAGGLGTGVAGAGFGGAGQAGAGGSSSPNDAGPRPLALLTSREYQNTVRELVGDAAFALPDLPADEQDLESGFAFHSTGFVNPASAQQYQAAAQAVATAALKNIADWLPCAATAGIADDVEAACLQALLGPGGFGSKIYRRPLSTTAIGNEVDRLSALYRSARQATQPSVDISDSVALVIETMLQTPEFMYHWEVDQAPAVREGSVVKLGSYEIANRLSYLLWGSMPDADLFAAAAAGQLEEASDVEAQVRRMLSDPKAADTFNDFFDDWLDFDSVFSKDPIVYPQYSAALAAAMREEAQRFVTAIVVNGSGRFDEILTSRASFANRDLATLYGLSSVGGSAFSAISLDPAQRSGLFTSAAFLSLTGDPDRSNPPRRGNAVYQKLLCQLLPPPPANVPPLDATSFSGSTRQLFEMVETNTCTAACHTQIDPLGFAFEHYDGIGAYRTLDNGAQVNSSVTTTLDAQVQAVAGAPELMALMATSDEVQTCFARQWFRYGLRRMDTVQDLPSLKIAANVFKSSLLDIRELVVALASSQTFRYRTPGTGEVLQ